MLQSIADQEVIHFQFGIINGYLIENLLIDCNIRCLKFNNHHRVGLNIVENSITPFFHSIHSQLFFHSNQSRRKLFDFSQIS